MCMDVVRRCVNECMGEIRCTRVSMPVFRGVYASNNETEIDREQTCDLRVIP